MVDAEDAQPAVGEAQRQRQADPAQADDRDEPFVVHARLKRHWGSGVTQLGCARRCGVAGDARQCCQPRLRGVAANLAVEARSCPGARSRARPRSAPDVPPAGPRISARIRSRSCRAKCGVEAPISCADVVDRDLAARAQPSGFSLCSRPPLAFRARLSGGRGVIQLSFCGTTSSRLSISAWTGTEIAALIADHPAVVVHRRGRAFLRVARGRVVEEVVEHRMRQRRGIVDQQLRTIVAAAPTAAPRPRRRAAGGQLIST